MTDHEHHIGQRFLRRRIDGERKLAHQDVALSRCGMTNCRGAFRPTDEHGIAFKKSPEWGDATARNRARPTAATGDCAADSLTSRIHVVNNFNFKIVLPSTSYHPLLTGEIVNIVKWETLNCKKMLEIWFKMVTDISVIMFLNMHFYFFSLLSNSFVSER